MTTFATLGIEFTSRTAAQAAKDLDAVEGAAGRAESRTDSLAGKSRRLATDILGVGTNSRKATDALYEVGKVSKKATDELERMNSAADLAGTVLGRLTAIVGTYLGAKAIVEMADSWSDMRSQLGAAIGDMEGASDMMMRMLEIAQLSYSPLEQTVQVYARNVTVLSDLGKSAQEAADFTESLNHMLVITATKGERAAAVQNALSKAMAVGRLQTDGLETVMANAGEVAQALANELGTTQSGLRALAQEGKITGQVIADAIITPLDDVRSVAAEMDATIGDGFTKIRNSLLALVGSFDQATGASLWLATQLDDISKWLTVLSQTDFEGWLNGIADTATGLAQIILVLAATRVPALTISLLATAKASWAANAGILATRASTGLMVAQMYAGVIAARGLAGVLALLGGPLGVAVAGLTAVGLAFWSNRSEADPLAGSLEDVAKAQRDLNDAVREYERTGSTDALEAAREMLKTELTRLESELLAAEQALRTAQMNIDAAGAGDFGMGALFDDERQAGLRAALEKVEQIKNQIAGTREQQALLTAEWEAAAQTLGIAADELTTAQLKAYQSAMDMLATSQRRIELLEIEQQYGKESVAYAATSLRHERDIYWAKLQTLDVADSIRNTLMEAWWEEQRLLGKTAEWDAVMGILEDTAGDVLAVLKDIGSTEPGATWLDTAIAKGSALWGVLAGAAAALAELSGVQLDAAGNVVQAGISPSKKPGSRPDSWNVDMDGDGIPDALQTGTGGKGGGGGGGGKSPVEDMKDRLKALEENFASEYELAMQHYARDQETLKWALDNKLMALEEYNDKVAMLQIDTWGAEWEKTALQYEMDQNALQGALDNKLIAYEDYFRKLKELHWANLLSEDNRSDLAQDLDNWGSYFGNLYSLTGSSFDSLLKLQRGFSAATALINAWVGYTTVLADPTVSFWIKFAAAGKVLAAGLGAVNAIKGSSGGGGSRGGGNSATASQAQESSPVNVSIALDPAGQYSGQQVIDMTNAVQKELKRRGVIFNYV